MVSSSTAVDSEIAFPDSGMGAYCRRRVLALAILLGAFGTCAWAQHNVPGFQQSGDNDCGPTAAAACLAYWQDQGFSIKTAANETDLVSLRAEIKKNTNQGGGRVSIGNLRDAVQKVIAGVTHADGRSLKAKTAKGSVCATSFDYLNKEFLKGEDIILLIKYKTPGEPDRHHFITVVDWKEGEQPETQRELEFMDPLTGSNDTRVVTVGDYDGKQRLIFDFSTGGPDLHPARVMLALTVSPEAHTTSDTSTGGTPPRATAPSVQYRVAYPPYRIPRGLHMRTDDPDPTHYSIQGLPTAWTWGISTGALGGLFVSVFDDGSGVPFPSGNAVTLSYTGPGRIAHLPRSIRLTGGGSGSPEDGVLVEEDGHRILLAGGAQPTRPGRPRAEVLAGAPSGELSARLTWAPSTGTGIVRYEIFDDNAGNRVGVSAQPEITLTGLAADTHYAFFVHAVAAGDVFSPASHLATVYRDEEEAPSYGPAMPGALGYTSLLSTWHESFTAWSLVFPPTSSTGSVLASTIHGEPDTVPAAAPGDIHPIHYHLEATAALPGSLIALGVPYDESHVLGDASGLRLYRLSASGWGDVTVGVDVGQNRVLGEVSEFGTIAIANGQAASPAGEVPGYSLEVARENAGEVRLSWDPSCLPGDDDFAVYDGPLGTFGSCQPVTCSTQGLTSFTYAPDPGDRYFLVVPRNQAREGSYGYRGDGTERPPSDDACLAQFVGVCP